MKADVFRSREAAVTAGSSACRQQLIMRYRVRKQLAEEGFEAGVKLKRRATPAVACCDLRRREGSRSCSGCSKLPLRQCAPAGPCGCWRASRRTRHCRIAPATNHRVHAEKSTTMPKRHRRKCWVIPPKANSAFVAADGGRAGRLHQRWPRCPTARWFASTRTRLPIPMKPGRPARCDYEYERNGTPTSSCCSRHSKAGARQGDGSSHRCGLRSCLEGPRRCSLRRCPDNRSRPGQSQHPHQGVTLPGLPGRRSPAAGRRGSNGVTRQSRQLAGIWRSRNSPSYRPSVSPAASPTNKSLSRKSPPGSTTPTPITPRPIGASQPQTPPSNSSAYTPSI